MICLFASFGVKSESDDLSGKKLLCNNFNINSYQKDPPDLIEVELLGYEFVSKMKEDDFNFHKRNNSKDYTVRPNYNLVFRYYLNLLNDTDSFDKDLLNYETTLQNIVILKNYKYKNLMEI